LCLRLRPPRYVLSLSLSFSLLPIDVSVYLSISFELLRANVFTKKPRQVQS
jgi:hypothetical protein